MNKTAKVKTVQANGTWEGKYGLMYKFEVEMDNGDTGEYMGKNKDQDYFVEGKEVDYDYHPHEKFPKIKKPKKDDFKPRSSGGGDKVQLYIIRQSSLKAAIDFNNIIMGDTKPTIDDICSDAEHFTKYVMRGLAGDKTNTGDTSNTEEKPPPPDETDLPF